jgi:glycosyltransferase involved in cell wall biosynthesis
VADVARAAWPPGPEKDEEVTLSVVLPSYREAHRLAAHVPVLQRHLRSLGVSHEIIVCDDGSDDAGLTRAVAEELGCRYFANAHNQGKGAALRRGMRQARGRFRLFTDAEIPYELDAIERALHGLDREGFHMVVGDRNLEESRYFREISLWRRVGSALCAFSIGRLVARGGFDTQCGLKAFRAEVAEDLFAVSRINRFAIDVELFCVALQRRYHIKRLCVRLRCRDGSSVHLVRDGLALLRDVVRIRWNQCLGRYARAGARAAAPEPGAPARGERGCPPAEPR